MQSNPVSQSDNNHAAYAWLLLHIRIRASHGLHSRWAATLAAADIPVVTEKNRVTQAASPHTHLALPTSSAPCLLLKGVTCFSCGQQCHNDTVCAGLHCCRYFGQPASVYNNWRPYRAYPGANFTAFSFSSSIRKQSFIYVLELVLVCDNYTSVCKLTTPCDRSTVLQWDFYTNYSPDAVCTQQLEAQVYNHSDTHCWQQLDHCMQ